MKFLHCEVEVVEITVGTMVFSKAGRDKGMLFLTLDVDEKYAYIADGEFRKVEKPKKKKIIHLQRINTVVEFDKNSITNSMVRKIIANNKPV